MQGCKCLAILVCLFFVACSGTKRKADCYNCPETQQSWKKFAWSDLKGVWRGSMESVHNDTSFKEKQKQETPVEIEFVGASEFFATHGVDSCGLAFPKDAIVLKGVLWLTEEKTKVAQKRTQGGRMPAGSTAVAAAKEKEYEVFGPGEKDSVVYGRATIQSHAGTVTCKFEKVEKKLMQNRLGLPAVDFTVREGAHGGRTLASGKPETVRESEFSLEFLNYQPSKPKISLAKGTRAPASLTVKDNPPLFLRVFRITNAKGGVYSTGEWQSTEEHLYRLWKVQ